MAKKLFGLSEKDVKRLEAMLNWFEKTSHNPPPPPRTRRPRLMAGAGQVALKLWRIKSLTTVDANGDANNYFAYYTCQECAWDAALYNLGNATPITYTGDDVIVCNIAECGETAAAALAIGDYLVGWDQTDNAGNTIHIGFTPKYAWIP